MSIYYHMVKKKRIPKISPHQCNSYIFNTFKLRLSLRSFCLLKLAFMIMINDYDKLLSKTIILAKCQKK